MATATLTYVYCLLERSAPPRLTRLPKGVPGLSAARAVAAAPGLWLIVADAPAARFSEAALQAALADIDWVSECALQHEATVASFLPSGTVVPMKLFTLFRDDERAIADVRRRKKKLGQVLTRIGGCQEWGLRILLDPRRVKPPRATTRPSSGTAFLAQKRAARHAATAELVQARQRVEGVYAELARHAKGARRRQPRPEEVRSAAVLEAAFLVPSAAARGFKGELTRVAKELGRGPFDVTVTGPWPAYNFVAER